MSFQANNQAVITSREAALEDLMGMLRTMRPAYSKMERQFIKQWLKPLGVRPDAVGNQILRIGDAPVLWSSHTDTVHWMDGPQRIERRGDIISLSKKEKRATCLGADCTTGVWIMREMILAQIPGLYIFHAAEERGGKGSSHIAYKTPGLLHGINYAIAFDRDRKNSVITFQGGMRCCSEAFSATLAEQLPGDYVSDDGGIFTDTAMYTHLIPECSNVSIGYYGGHCKTETQSASHALLLREAMLNIDVSQFACERNPYTCKESLWDKWEPSGKAAIIDGPWDDYEEELVVDNETWIKRNGEWFRLDDVDDWEEEEEGRDYLNPYSYAAFDPLEFNGWKPKKYKY